MSAFHPAVRGILEAALTEHQQAANLARLAAGPGREDAAGRLDEIATGVQRMIDAITPDNYGHTQVERLTDNQRAHALMGRLLTELADYNLQSWEKRYDSLVINLHSAYGGDRAAFHDIADRLALKYVSKPFSTSTDTDHVSATGVIDGIKVEFYALLLAEPPRTCSIHGLAFVDDVCEQCENPGIHLEDDDQATIAQARAVEAENDVRFERRAENAAWLDAHPDDDEEDFVEEDFVEYVDPDAPVTHACSPRTGLARCGDNEPDPVFSNIPTCPTCDSLQRAKTPPTTSTAGATDEP